MRIVEVAQLPACLFRGAALPGSVRPETVGRRGQKSARTAVVDQMNSDDASGNWCTFSPVIAGCHSVAENAVQVEVHCVVNGKREGADIWNKLCITARRTVMLTHRKQKGAASM